MILDKRTEFFSGQAIPTTAGTSILGNVIDTGTVNRNLGMGEQILWYIACTTAGAGGTSVQFNLVSADNSAMTTNLTVHDSTPVILLANLTAKVIYENSLPMRSDNLFREYVGVQAVVAGTFTGGIIASGLTLDPIGNLSYPQGVN